MRRKLKVNYYKFLIKRNHIIWWLNDNIIMKFHQFIDSLNDLYWRFFWKMRGFV